MLGIGDLHPSQKIEAYVTNIDEDGAALVRSFGPAISDITRLNGLQVVQDQEKPDDAATYIFNDIEIYVPLKGLVDVDGEREKLERERTKAEASLKQVRSKLGNENFLAKAPEAIVAKERTKLEELEARLARISEAEAQLERMEG